MKFRYKALAITAVTLFTLSCTKDIFQIESDSSPSAVFRHIWNDYNENYGLFAVKKVNWDSVFQRHAAEINGQTSSAQLYVHVTEMLGALNDRHITLYPATNPELPTWSVDLDASGTYVLDHFNGDVIKDNYLSDYREPNEVVQYAQLAGGVGYIHISNFDGTRNFYDKALDQALADLRDSPALILDIRDNAGGYDPNAQYVAGRFAASAALYMTTRKKNGPGPDDFAETREWQVLPTGDSQYTKSLLVLTSTSTASAAETFLLALLTQTHVRQVGMTTAGSFSDNPNWEAPNGWLYSISVGDYRAADGKSYEGIGLAPQVLIQSRREDWLEGKDVVLEKALEQLK